MFWRLCYHLEEEFWDVHLRGFRPLDCQYIDTEAILHNVEEYSSSTTDQVGTFKLRRNRVQKLKEIDTLYSGYKKKDENEPDYDEGSYHFMELKYGLI